MGGLLFSLAFSFDDDSIAEIEEMLASDDGVDLLSEILEEGEAYFPNISKVLIHERNLYMMYRMHQIGVEGERIVCAVGAGHVPGIKEMWDTEDLAELPLPLGEADVESATWKPRGGQKHHVDWPPTPAHPLVCSPAKEGDLVIKLVRRSMIDRVFFVLSAEEGLVRLQAHVKTERQGAYEVLYEEAPLLAQKTNGLHAPSTLGSYRDAVWIKIRLSSDTALPALQQVQIFASASKPGDVCLRDLVSIPVNNHQRSRVLKIGTLACVSVAALVYAYRGYARGAIRTYNSSV